MTGVFFVGRRLRRYDIIDSAWGLVFIVIASTSLIMSDTFSYVQLLTFGLVILWGLRLSRHIYRRFRASAHEDKRYVEMRRKWRSGNENVVIYFRIYVTQAILASLICVPVIIINSVNVEAALPFVIVGLTVWLIGFSIEAAADRELREFIRQPEHKGQLMTQGLWRYSRHPNYFGELTLWWGVGIIVLSVPYGWIGLIGPLLISYLLVFVSGVPPTEKAFAGRPGWTEYKSRTSILVPWVVKKNQRTK
jgi:steroid 5-alpha reductase family enzyme